ncbi:CRE-CPNA-2 protein, partial [Aphelenchoides avenae]
MTDLDEATLDLLRISTEPTSISFSSTARVSPNADKLPKAASTSSMHKVIRTKDGGTLKLANQFTWDEERLKSNSPDSISASLAGAVPPQPTQQPGPSRGVGSAFRPTAPPPMPPSGTTTTTGTINDEYEQNGETTESHRREYVAEGEHHRIHPPVVRTTVEGKLKMEKSVGAHLRTIDHSIAKAYTIRDTTTHYLIRTRMGRREIVIEEGAAGAGTDDAQGLGVRSSGTYKLSVYEDGQEIGRHEADIHVPDNMSKPDYLAKLSEQLLADLATLDGEEITAATRVEVERVEDITDIVKTYLIGQAVPELEEEVPAAITAPAFVEPEFNYESASDNLSERATPIALENKAYIDTLEREQETELETKGINIVQEGRVFEDIIRIGPAARAIPDWSDTESVDSILAKRREPRCTTASADCDLQRREDQSFNEVIFAQARVEGISLLLRTERLRRRKEPEPAAYGLERQGQSFADRTVLRTGRRFESEEEERKEPEQEERKEPEPASYGLERQGQSFADRTVL